MRSAIKDFALANRLYAGATVTFYTVSGGAKTATKATLYAGPTGSTTLGNPQVLGADGMLKRAVYIEVPTIATITGLTVASHDTGIINPAPSFRINSSTYALEFSYDNGTTWTASSSTLFKYRGAWATGTAYAFTDTFADSGILYYAAAAHTAAASLSTDVSAGRVVGFSSLTLPLALNQGGTGAASASAARTNLALGSLATLKSVKEYGAVGDGTTDDTVAIQACIDAEEDVYFPAGDYKISAVLLVPSNRRISGSGFNSRIFCTATSSGQNMAWIGGTQWFIFLNSNAVTDSANSNIEITQLFLDFSLRPTVGHNIHMHKVNGLRIHNNWIKYGNDAVSLTACFDFQVTNNKAWNQNNACYDVWEASYDGLIANNIGRNVDGYGVILTGNNTLEQTGITKNITIANNILIGPDSGTASAGIWLQGGMTWTTNGCRHCAVTGNYMSGYYNGVKITGGRFNTVVGNTIERCYEAGIQFGFETAGNETTYCVASGNTLDDCSYNATSYPIEFQNNVSFNTASGNIVGTHSAAYALGFYSGTANNIAANNTLKAGSTGTVINAGAATNVVYGANASGIWETSGNYISLDDSSGTNRLRIGFGTAAPTTGAWKRGEQVLNSNPAVGAAKGWTCTTAGTPGTWTSQGNL